VKFLVDRCAGRKLAEWLRSKGHDVLESRTLGADPGDRELLEKATEEARILVTIDSDFAQLVYIDHVFHCGIVRLPDVPAEGRIELMETVFREHASALNNREIITVRGRRIRISKPPSTP
jgi:predicted nuclease of predicted toxin-antitoxin system